MIIARCFVLLLFVARISFFVQGMESGNSLKIVIRHYDQFLFYEAPLPLVDLSMDVLLQNASEKEGVSELERENFKNLQKLFSGDYFERICERTSWRLGGQYWTKDWGVYLARTFSALVVGHLKMIDKSENLSSEEKEFEKINFGVRLLKNGTYQFCDLHNYLKDQKELTWSPPVQIGWYLPL